MSGEWANNVGSRAGFAAGSWPQRYKLAHTYQGRVHEHHEARVVR